MNAAPANRPNHNPPTSLKPALAMFFLYAAIQAALRVATSNSLELDEAEQVLLAQHWAWGYGGQPPLYTWLQAALFALCGTNVAALALLKALLIFGVLALSYLIVHQAGGSEKTALAAATAWFLLPHFAWEARRDLSHTVLALAAVMATIFFAVRWQRRPGLASALGLGLSAALGVLSKYNFLLFLAAFALAALSLQPVRASLRDRRLLVALALFLGVSGAHAAWFLAHPDLATSGHQKLFASGPVSRAHAVLTGLGSLLLQGVPAVLPLAAACWLCALRKLPAQTPAPSAAELSRVLGRTLLFGAALCALLAVAFQVQFKARWLLPLLALAPLYAALALWTRAGEPAVAWLARIGSLAALVALVALPAAAPLASLTGKFTRLNAPYAELAARLRTGGVAPELILAENRLVGGNLKLFFPASRVLVPELPSPPPTAPSQRLVVWDATRRASMPATLAAFARPWCEGDPATLSPRFVEATQKYSRTRTMRLGFVLLPPPTPPPTR